MSKRRFLSASRLQLGALARLLLFSAFAASMFWACQVTQEGKDAETLSFASLYDSLSGYDSVIIAVTDSATGATDTVFRGKVASQSVINDLEVPHYSGKGATIFIVGFNEGILAFRLDRIYDGVKGAAISDKVIFSFRSAVACGVSELRMVAGDSVALPMATVSPPELSDKTLIWSSSEPTVFRVEGDMIIAANAGSADLSARLKSDPSKAAVVRITVAAKVIPPQIDIPVVPAPDKPRIPAPSGLSYAVNPAVYWKSAAISANPPSVSGVVELFTVTPPLPAGLSLDKTTGLVTGEPSEASARSEYSIRAWNAGGDVSTILSITVNPPPAGLAYRDGNPVCWQALACPIDSATVSGIVDSFTVSPALPAGLSLNKATGAISGTPSVIAAAAKFTVTARNPAGSVNVELNLTVNGAPSGFSYASNPVRYPVGVAVFTNMPTVSGPVDGFTISPELPPGLSLNPATGAITGVPTSVSSPSVYTVTAKNLAGSPTVALNLSVFGPPSGLNYPAPTAVYWQSVAIAENIPGVTESVDSFSVAPGLPPGLRLDKITGVITGTPTAASAWAAYMVTARNGAGSTGKVLTVEVKGPPAGMAYSKNPAAYIIDNAIATNVASVSGEQIAFSVQPALPAGLSLNPLSGAVTGTPTALMASALYTITASNPAGSDKVDLSLGVVVNPLGTLTYSANPAVYWKNVALTAMTRNVPTVSGGANDFTIKPALPAGLVLDKVTGVISGKPTGTPGTGNYVVTTWNSTGASTTASLAITVNGPPTGFSYTKNPVAFANMVAADSDRVKVSGVVDSFTMATALPAGLFLNKSTGAIGGTPKGIAAAKDYVVTAWNPAGSVSVSLNLAVVPIPLGALTYSVNPATYWEGVAIAANAPTITGGADDFASSVALPAGLTMDKATGVITGTPTHASNASIKHVITARNPSGATSAADLDILVYGPPVLGYGGGLMAYTGSYGEVWAFNSGGLADKYSISPPLPAGYSIDSITGIVSGTALTAMPQTDFTITAVNPAGIGKDTLSLEFRTMAGALQIRNVLGDISVDTGHAQGLQNGYTGASFIGKPGQPFFAIWKFGIMTYWTLRSPLVSAKVRYKTYAYGPVWNGSPKTLTVKLYRLKHSWYEGYGNWNYYKGNWYNNGEVLYQHYPLSQTIKAGSDDYHNVTGLLYTEHYIVRPENLTLVSTQSITVTYPAASIHTSFSVPIPAPDKLVNLDIDVTDYVKPIIAETESDYGYVLMIEGLGTDANNWIGTMNKEAGDGNEDESDGNFGAKLYLQY